MTDEQEWCLHCGAAVGTRVVAAPGWRTPIAIAGAILLVAVIAIAIALVQLADDTGKVQQAAPVTPAPTAAPVATPTPALPEASGQTTPTPTPTTTPSPTPTPNASSSGDATWPPGKTGWTVVLASDSSKSDAQGKADSFAQNGIAGVGVLHSDGFSSLKPGSWIVFSGQYDSQSQAANALDGVDVKDAYIRHVVPN
jgi:sporulation related protein